MVARRSVCSAVLGLVLLAADAGAGVLEQAKTAAFELGMESETPPRQRSLERMMTGLVLAMAGGRLVWYRFEDKDCREPEGTRCAWAVGAGAAGLAVGVLLMTVLATTPAAPSVSFEPQPGGVAVRAVVGFSCCLYAGTYPQDECPRRASCQFRRTEQPLVIPPTRGR